MRNYATAFVGVILITVGAMGLFYRGVPYASRDVVIDVGPLKATAETRKMWPVSPVLGGLAIASGVVLIITAVRRA